MPKVLTWLLTISLIFVVLPAVNPVYAENSCNFGSGSNEGQITLENDDILQVPASTAANYTLSFKLDSKAFSLLQGTHIRLETGGGWFGIGSVYTNITHITSDRFTITLNRSQFPNTSSGLEAFNKFASSGDHNIGVTGVTGGVTPLCHLTYKISPTGVPSGSTGGSGTPPIPSSPRVCGGLPQIPASITPTSGTRRDAFTVTLQWSQLSAADFALYSLTDVYIDVLNESGVSVLSTGAAGSVKDINPRLQVDKGLILSDLNIDEDPHNLLVHLHKPAENCYLELSPLRLTLLLDDKDPGKLPGERCDPAKFADPVFACTGGTTCALQCDNSHICADKPQDCGPSALTKELRKVLVTKTCYDPGSTIPIDKTTQQYCSSAAGTLCPINDAQRMNTSNSSGPNKWTGITSALGCVPTDPKDLIPAILRLATGAGGGIAFLLMIMGAFQMITSAGNPDSLKTGQGRFTSAIIGLLFVIFSVLLLQIIGVDILNIPGFTR